MSLKVSVASFVVVLLASTYFLSNSYGENLEVSKRPVVAIETNLGEIVVELWPDKAPLTVKNFLKYVEAGAYNGTIFHRVIDGFMIQGGGFRPDMTKIKTLAPIKNEARPDVKNFRGTIAMARTGVIDSATSQFFINVRDNHFLDHRDNSPRGFGYAVFGKVIKGMDVVDKIAKVRTTSRGLYRDVPVEPVIIKSVKKLGSSKEAR